MTAEVAITDGGNESAKAAHVNMMTDIIIANLPPEALHSIVRSLLGIDAKNTPAFHNLASKYLKNTKLSATSVLFEQVAGKSPEATTHFCEFQQRYRCLMGCGQGFETLQALYEALAQLQALEWEQSLNKGESFLDILANIDSDLVQAVTAVQKELTTSLGMRSMNETEGKTTKNLRKVLFKCKTHAESGKLDFPFQRGFMQLDMLLGEKVLPVPATTRAFISTKSDLETLNLGGAVVPRIFIGLWQFSSPAWGTASRSKINAHFRRHVDAGFIAFEMADHYGDAEVTFGQFRAEQLDSNQIYCATKWCVFERVTVSEELVKAGISERITNINAESVELLQFHWQNYNDHQYIKAAKLIEEDPRVNNLGLCNFDTKHMDEILESGVNVVSNQVQFSLVDLRPTFKMADSCRKHSVKLLTYGSLCGGLLADKWLGEPAPNLFDENMTPSNRKYLEMIMVWGGWSLFQELLSILAVVGQKYSVSISVIASRWVLDHDYVGSVIIGARMGISEHIEENLKVFSFKLDSEDQAKIKNVLDLCRAREVFEAMGDCGSEYRQ